MKFRENEKKKMRLRVLPSCAGLTSSVRVMQLLQSAALLHHPAAEFQVAKFPRTGHPQEFLESIE